MGRSRRDRHRQPPGPGRRVTYYRASGQDNLKRDVISQQNTCVYEAVKQGASLKTGKTLQHCSQPFLTCLHPW